MRSITTALGAAIALCAAAPAAHAFCGFYINGAGAEMFNNATQVVLMRHGTTTILSMQNNYQGPPEAFALVVPVPVVVKEAQVKTLPRELFGKVDVLGAPRLVEYWEQDPCAPPEPEYDYMLAGATSDDEDEDGEGGGGGEDYHVKIEAKFSVAEYDIVVLSATQATGLDHWLRDNHYQIPKGTEPLLRPYVEAGTKFFVAKVDPKKVKFVNGMATLSPLRVQYDSPEFSLPIRLGLANSSGTQDLIVNVLAPNNQRYEVANYPNVTIPTNLNVTDAVRTRFGEFYAALFDHTIEKVPHAVVTEYAWDTSSCDPCPGPTLDETDLATLGADVLQATYRDVNPYGFTLTRLHARYGKDLSDDLVFKAVGPIEGGRGIPDAAGKMTTGVSDTGTNNFQGRYVILHPWTGQVACEAPQRGNWGGPPANAQQIAQPIAATNTAFAPRGQTPLASMVAVDIPEIGVMASPDAKLAAPHPLHKPQGCTCTAAGAGSAAGAAATAALAGLGLVLVLRRRRR